MRITQYPRETLPTCCQLRRDWFEKVENGDQEPQTQKQHLEKVKGEYYRHFQALLIGNCIYENMGKKTCLDCLNFRHEALHYYDNLFKGKFKEKEKESKK